MYQNSWRFLPYINFTSWPSSCVGRYLYRIIDCLVCCNAKFLVSGRGNRLHCNRDGVGRDTPRDLVDGFAAPSATWNSICENIRSSISNRFRVALSSNWAQLLLVNLVNYLNVWKRFLSRDAYIVMENIYFERITNAKRRMYSDIWSGGNVKM